MLTNQLHRNINLNLQINCRTLWKNMQKLEKHFDNCFAFRKTFLSPYEPIYTYVKSAQDTAVFRNTYRHLTLCGRPIWRTARNANSSRTCSSYELRRVLLL